MFRKFTIVWALAGLLAAGMGWAQDAKPAKTEAELGMCKKCAEETAGKFLQAASDGGKIVVSAHDCLVCSKGKTNPLLEGKICDACAVKEMICQRCLISLGWPKHLDDVKAPAKDGIIFISDRDGENEIFIMDADGKNPKQLTKNEAVEMDPAVSPDGKWIVFTSRQDGQWDLYLLDTGGAHLRRLTRTPEPELSACWFPDGKQLCFVLQEDKGFKLLTISRDGTNLKAVELPVEFQGKGIGTPAVSPDGKKIAFTGSEGENDATFEIYVWEEKGTVNRLTDNKAFDSGAVWSPDGKRIAFVSNRDGNDEIYLMDAAGKNVKRLTDNKVLDTLPMWTSKGDKIVFASSRDAAKEGVADVYIMDSDGKNQVDLTNNPAKDLAPKWAKGGKK